MKMTRSAVAAVHKTRKKVENDSMNSNQRRIILMCLHLKLAVGMMCRAGKRTIKSKPNRNWQTKIEKRRSRGEHAESSGIAGERDERHNDDDRNYTAYTESQRIALLQAHQHAALCQRATKQDRRQNNPNLPRVNERRQQLQTRRQSLTCTSPATQHDESRRNK